MCVRPDAMAGNEDMEIALLTVLMMGRGALMLVSTLVVGGGCGGATVPSISILDVGDACGGAGGVVLSTCGAKETFFIFLSVYAYFESLSLTLHTSCGGSNRLRLLGRATCGSGEDEAGSKAIRLLSGVVCSHACNSGEGETSRMPKSINFSTRQSFSVTSLEEKYVIQCGLSSWILEFTTSVLVGDVLGPATFV